jgi:hypothetical protein
MLNFEDEMKAVRRGYVVLDIDEYDRLRDELAEAKMAAYNAEQITNRRVADLSNAHEGLLNSLFSIRKVSYSHTMDVDINREVLHMLAVERLQRDHWLEGPDKYDVVPVEAFSIYDGTIARRKPDEAVEKPETMDVEDIDW